MRIIKLNDNYVFGFLENNSKVDHPVSDYYLKLDDLSINLIISLKWILWGYYFLDSISKEIKNDNYSSFDYIFTDTIQKIKDIEEEDHILTLDDSIIKNKDELENLLKTFYTEDLFDENSKIHFKLKLNLREYLIISSLHFPVILRIIEKT